MMEKNRQTKVIAIIALVVAVVGMSLGFAAFSNILTISSSATVTPNSEDFKVVLSGSRSDPYYTTLEAMVESSGATAEDAIVVNEDGKSSTSLKVGFTEPGQKVYYNAYIHNVGAYTAYLNKVEFGNVVDTEVKKVCTPVGDTTPELVASACESIKFWVYMNDSGVDVQDTMTFEDMFLSAGKSAGGELWIHYLDDGTRADGPFTVEFGDLTFHFSTVN